MPLLTRAEKVEILCVSPDAAKSIDGADLAAHLARHCRSVMVTNVIESGRLHASMRFHIDARSAAGADRGSTLDLRNEADASGKLGFGPWGGRGEGEKYHRLCLDVPKHRGAEHRPRSQFLCRTRVQDRLFALAGREQVDRIKVHTLNPEAEAKAAAEASQARDKRIGDSETTRRQALDKAISAASERPPTPQPTKQLGPEQARQAAPGRSPHQAAPNRPRPHQAAPQRPRRPRRVAPNRPRPHQAAPQRPRHRMLSVLLNAVLPHGFVEPRRFRKIACSYSAQG